MSKEEKKPEQTQMQVYVIDKKALDDMCNKYRKELRKPSITRNRKLKMLSIVTTIEIIIKLSSVFIADVEPDDEPKPDSGIKIVRPDMQIIRS